MARHDALAPAGGRSCLPLAGCLSAVSRLGQVPARVGVLLTREDRHRRPHAPETQLAIQGFPPRRRVEDDLPVALASLKEARGDARPEAAALMARQHGYVAQIGE